MWERLGELNDQEPTDREEDLGVGGGGGTDASG